MPVPVRVAVWQCAPVPGAVDANLDRLAAACAEAAAAGADLLVAPEMVTTGYAVGAAATRALAEPADPARGASAARVAGLAAAHGLVVAYGFGEVGEGSGPDGAPRVHNSVNVIGPAGLLATHRKVHLWGVDHDQVTAGTVPPAGFALPLDARDDRPATSVPAGALVCFDVEVPEAPRHLAAAGARLVVVPTANPVGYDEVQDLLLRTRALESGLVLAYANQVGSDGALTYNGRSCVVAADGTVLAEADGHEEALLVVDVVVDPGALAPHLAARAAEVYAVR